MTHKANVTIGFDSRVPSAFGYSEAIIKTLKDFWGQECQVEVFDFIGRRYDVEFTLFSRKSIQHLNWQVQLLVKYLKEHCDVTEFKANAWSSQEYYDAWLDLNEGYIFCED